MLTITTVLDGKQFHFKESFYLKYEVDFKRSCNDGFAKFLPLRTGINVEIAVYENLNVENEYLYEVCVQYPNQKKIPQGTFLEKKEAFCKACELQADAIRSELLKNLILS